MVYPESIVYIFKEINDPLYFTRFIDYIVTKKFNEPSYLDIKSKQCKILISGFLEDIHTEKKYTSLTDFYNKVTGLSINIYDESLFHHIYLKNKSTLHSLISSLTDNDLMEFTDERYRIFTMIRDLRDRIKHYTGFICTTYKNKYVLLIWNNVKYLINIYEIKEYLSGCKTENCIALLKTYESGLITNLYYNKPDTNEYYKISN
jgi:hypothetical protein